MKRLTIIVALGVALAFGSIGFGAEFRRARTFEQAHGAVCRVAVSGARGTGAFVGVDGEGKSDERCVVLTNYHVVGDKNQTATLDFWTNGVRETVTGKIFMRFYDANVPNDFALIEVDPRELARINPFYLALGGAGAAPSKDAYILSAGCPKGRFAQAWKGKVLGYYNGVTIMFQPGPVPGQSGSPIVEAIDGELWVTGILTWLLGTEGADDSRGGAIPIANLYEAIKGRRSATGDHASPIPPDATECADRDPYVIEFSQDNCPPCKDAEKDVETIRSKGYEVRAYNVSRSEEGKRLAEVYHVIGTPEFVVCDGNGTMVASYIGSGKASRICEDLAALKKAKEQKIEPAPSPLPVHVPKPAIEKKPEPETGTLDLTISEPTPDPEPKQAEAAPETLEFNYVPVQQFDEITGDSQAFRYRAPVYEYYSDSGFFDESNSRWLNRRRTDPRENDNGESPNDSPKADDSDKSRGRLFGGGNSLEKQIDGAIGKIEKRIDDKVNAKSKEAKKQALDVYHKWRWRVLMFCVAVVIVSCLIAEGIAAALGWIADRIYRNWKLFREWWKETELESEREKIETVETSEPSEKVSTAKSSKSKGSSKK